MMSLSKFSAKGVTSLRLVDYSEINAPGDGEMEEKTGENNKRRRRRKRKNRKKHR